MSEVKVGDEAVEHLLRVTSGLDSIVLGETQILGQMRDAFFLAQETGTTGTIFNHLFKQAITFAKEHIVKQILQIMQLVFHMLQLN